jgi:cytochrome c
VHHTCLLLTQSGHDPCAASTFGSEKPIGIGSKVVIDRNGLGRVALLSGIAYLALSTFSASEELVSQNEDVTSGQLVFNNVCRMCHSIKEGDNRLGPHVRGIIGRKAGSLPNYTYSSAMKGANFVWDEEILERFIANPDETVPGNNMKPYGGLASADSRVKLIAFLKTLTAEQ